MGTDLTSSIVLITFATFCLGWWISSFYLPKCSGFVVALIKALIPFAYFSWFDDKTWRLLDDVSYAKQGTSLLKYGWNPFTILFSHDGLSLLFAISQSTHILYGWWNFLAQYLFGPHYYSAVFMNVVLTFVTGLAFDRILKRLDFSQTYRKWFCIFLLLNVSILAWSSFLNLKDIFVMTLTSISLLFSLQIIQTKRLMYILFLALACFVFGFIRFYVPLLILAAFLAYQLLNLNSKIILLVVGAAGAAGYYIKRHLANFNIVRPSHMLFGWVRTVLTPQPWAIDPAYTFLLLPSIFNWLFFIPSFFSAYVLWKRSKFSRFLILYALVVITIYAMVPELQGPRHRIQILPIIIWFQFHFIWWLLPHRLENNIPSSDLMLEVSET